MSFHKRKKKQTINSSAAVLTSTPDNPISFAALSGYSVCVERDQSDKPLAASHASDSNGVVKMTCDNNNKDGHSVVAIVENGPEKAIPRQIEAAAVAENDLKSQVANQSDLSHHDAVCNKTSTSPSSSAKRKFIVLTRLFKPWKWKRKKKTEKSVKGKLSLGCRWNTFSRINNGLIFFFLLFHSLKNIYPNSLCLFSR